MARRICKLLMDQRGLTPSELRALIAQEISAYKRAGERGRSVPRIEDFDPALELAVVSGWLSEQEGKLLLTAEGEALALRSRSTRRVSRFRQI